MWKVAKASTTVLLKLGRPFFTGYIPLLVDQQRENMAADSHLLSYTMNRSFESWNPHLIPACGSGFEVRLDAKARQDCQGLDGFIWKSHYQVSATDHNQWFEGWKTGECECVSAWRSTASLGDAEVDGDGSEQGERHIERVMRG